MDIVSEPIELDALEPSQEETVPVESTLEPARVEPKRGRPKGSTNKPKGAPILAPIPEQIQPILAPIPEQIQPIQPIPAPKARAIAKARAPRAEPRVEVRAEVRDPVPASINDLLHLLSLRLSDERESRQQRRTELYRGFLE
jgi:hypothetical protein